MNPSSTNRTAASYDRVAQQYGAQFFGELEHKPLDRAMLDAFTEEVRALSPEAVVADIGCGPGHVSRYLSERGVQAMGIDLSPAMVALASQLSPAIPFRVGSMLALDLSDATLGGIAAFYSIIHIPPAQVADALREFSRVLRPGGLLLLAFHVGDELRHLDEFMGQPVSLDFQFYQPATLERELQAVGFDMAARLVRAPYVPHEHPSQRGYLLARKPRTTEM